MDLSSRRVVGWSLQPQMQRRLVIDALEMAWQQRRPAKGKLLFHSDRGSQYASADFTRFLDEHGITGSMSRKGNCWDNACSETLFGSLYLLYFTLSLVLHSIFFDPLKCVHVRTWNEGQPNNITYGHQEILARLSKDFRFVSRRYRSAPSLPS
jgi:transposase InsO family protein